MDSFPVANLALSFAVQFKMFVGLIVHEVVTRSKDFGVPENWENMGFDNTTSTNQD